MTSFRFIEAELEWINERRTGIYKENRKVFNKDNLLIMKHAAKVYLK
jgi:hypothetical protein